MVIIQWQESGKTRWSATLTFKLLCRHSPQTFVRVPDFIILVHLKTLHGRRNDRLINWSKKSHNLIHNRLSLVIIVSRMYPDLPPSGMLAA